MPKRFEKIGAKEWQELFALWRARQAAWQVADDTGREFSNAHDAMGNPQFVTIDNDGAAVFVTAIDVQPVDVIDPAAVRLDIQISGNQKERSDDNGRS